MDKYYTIMIIPDKGEKNLTFRVPSIIFKSITLFCTLLTLIIVVFAYNYRQVIGQIYQNKHLTIENNKLRQQISFFQMQIGKISNDLERIHIFEKKLKVITGIDNTVSPPTQTPTTPSPLPSLPSTAPMQAPLPSNQPLQIKEQENGISQAPLIKNSQTVTTMQEPFTENTTPSEIDFRQLDKKEEFIALKDEYHQKLLKEFGIPSGYMYTKVWSELSQKSLYLAAQFAEINYKMKKIDRYMTALEHRIFSMDEFLIEHQTLLLATPTIYPTKGWLTSFFGARQNPVSGRMKQHEGIDIGAPIGTDIIAPAEGVITYSGWKPGFGKYLQIDHGFGIETAYGHNDSLYVLPGQSVKRGDTIARVGNTGLSTGPHLHYEVRVNGVHVDPLYFILN